jgi:pimeloyl-ACP methyl ester carboxylesterase
MKMLRWIVGIMLVLIALPFAFLYFMQDRLLYPGAQAAAPFGDLVIVRPDLTLRGWVLHPEANDALVVFGGNGMSLSRFAPRLADCTSRAVYLLPYRGYEGQAGAPRERDMVADGIALVDEAKKRHAHVAVVGISIGTGVATQVAVARPPDRLVLVTPYDNLGIVGSDAFGGVPLGWLMHDRFDSAAAAARLGEVPVYVLQANHDEVIGAARTEGLVRALPRLPVRVDHVDAGHNTILRSDAFCRALQF